MSERGVERVRGRGEGERDGERERGMERGMERGRENRGQQVFNKSTDPNPLRQEKKVQLL